MTRPLLALLPAALLLLTAHRAAAAPVEKLSWIAGTAGRLRVSDGGKGGVPVVFLHGLGSDREAWRAQLDHVRGGRRAIAYDQRGHGDSDRARDGVYTLEALAADLESVRIALGLGKVVLVGHSLSGAVLTTYAGLHPEAVAGLVYVDAIGDAHAFPRDQVAALVAKETAPGFGAPERRAVFEEMLATARPATRKAVLASLERIDPPAFGLLRKALFELVDGPARLARYKGPAVAVEEGDKPWPGGAAAVLGVPRVAVHDTCHWIQLDQPEVVSQALDRLLSEVGDGS